jgi:hypothetical protein
MYLEDVAQWIDTQDFDFVYWNMLHDAYYFSIGTMPTAAKHVATARLQHANIPEKFQDEVGRIIDFMNNGASLDGQLLRMKIEDLDFKRQQRLVDYLPELAHAIEYE